MLQPNPQDLRHMIQSIERIMKFTGPHPVIVQARAVVEQLPVQRPCRACVMFTQDYCAHWEMDVPALAQPDGCDHWEEDIPF